METPPSTLPDPVTLIRQLDPEKIRDRIATIDAERAALVKLLRVANAASVRKAAVNNAR
jgi:hypothetical protein